MVIVSVAGYVALLVGTGVELSRGSDMIVYKLKAAIKLYDGGVYTVGTDNSVKLELKGSIPGGSLTAYVTDWNLMHYASKYAGPKVLMLVEGKAYTCYCLSDTNSKCRSSCIEGLCKRRRSWTPSFARKCGHSAASALSRKSRMAANFG